MKTTLLLAMLLFATFAGCGGSEPATSTPELPPDPPWVATFEADAERGCECSSEACFDEVRVKLDSVVTASGGFDDVPSTVHAAHKRFTTCFRDGTMDLDRDLALAATEICGCQDATCASSFQRTFAQLENKYQFANPTLPSDATDAARSSLMKISHCVESVSIAAADYIQVRRDAVDAMCECADMACVETASERESEALSGKLIIADEETVRGEASGLTERACMCLGNAISQDVAKSLYPGVDVSVRASIKCN